jgi:transcriptional regulator with XRE-family HTH domain
MSDIRERLFKRFRDPEYRHSYLEEFLNSVISAQIRTLREQRGWSQADLAEKIGTTQSAISRIENPNYSAWKLETLRKIARALDQALTVKFVSFGDALGDVERFRTDKLIRPSFEEDPVFHGEIQKEVSASDVLAPVITFRGNPVNKSPLKVASYG